METTSVEVKRMARLQIGRAIGRLGKYVVYAVITLWAGLGVFAFLWIAFTAFKTNPELFSGKVWALPQKWMWKNYVDAWTRFRIGRYFLNSVVVSLVAVAVLDVIGSMAAYVLARFPFPGNRLVLAVFISGLAFPAQLVVVPLFLFYGRLKLVNTLIGLIVCYVAVSLPFTVFVLTGFFRTLPTDLEDAAVIDGCSEHGVFWRVLLPLASPGLVTVSIFNFLGAWNEYMFALILVVDEEAMTVPLGLYNLMVAQSYANNWTGLMAGLVIAMVPSLIVYILLQRQIARGLTMGALKG